MVAPVPAPPSNHCKEQEEHSGPSKRIDSTVPSLSSTQSPSRPLATFGKPMKNLTFADLLEATNGFHNDRLIGSGGFGDVYKAQLKDGNVVAIKKLIHVSGQGDREFMAEMETIGKAKPPASSGSSADGFSLGSVLIPPREAQARGWTPPSSPRQLPPPDPLLPAATFSLPSPFLYFSSGTFPFERQPSPDSALGRPWLRVSLPVLAGGDSRSPWLRPGRRRLSVSSAPVPAGRRLPVSLAHSS